MSFDWTAFSAEYDKFRAQHIAAMQEYVAANVDNIPNGWTIEVGGQVFAGRRASPKPVVDWLEEGF